MLVRRDIVGLVLLCILTVINQFYFIPVQVVEEGSDPIYPQLMNGLLLFLLFCYALEILHSRYRKAKSLAVLKLVPQRVGKVILLLVLVGVWAFMLDCIGFILPTMGFLGITTYLYGERSPKKIVAAMLLSPVMLYLLFTIFGAFLPQGPLEQYIRHLLLS